MGEVIDKLVKKLPARYWGQICSTWLKNIPTIEPPGNRPSPIVENADLAYYCEQAIPEKKKELSYASGPVAGLREEIFHESVYWLHKAVHALCGAESKVASGMLTWSIIDAYLAAYFSMRSISAILGVSICDYKGRSCVVDLCRDFKSMARMKREAESAFAEEVNVHSLGVRFDHKQCWQVLQRLLRVVYGEVWDQELSKCVNRLNSPDFARHRNRISYYVHEWLEDDLHHPAMNEDFALRAIHRDPLKLDTEDSGFTVQLAYSLLTMALTAYRDVASVGLSLKGETELISHSLGTSRHPYFGYELASILSTS